MSSRLVQVFSLAIAALLFAAQAAFLFCNVRLLKDFVCHPRNFAQLLPVQHRVCRGVSTRSDGSVRGVVQLAKRLPQWVAVKQGGVVRVVVFAHEYASSASELRDSM